VKSQRRESRRNGANLNYSKAMTETLYPTCCNSHCNQVFDKNPKKATDLCCYKPDQRVGNGSIHNEEKDEGDQ